MFGLVSAFAQLTVDIDACRISSAALEACDASLMVYSASKRLMDTGVAMNTRYEPNDAPEPASCVYFVVDPLDLRAG